MYIKGDVCPQCERCDRIVRFTKPYSSRHMLDAAVFGVIGMMAAASDRHAWRRCEHCDAVFRPKTRAIVKWLLWLLLMPTVAFCTVAFVAMMPDSAIVPTQWKSPWRDIYQIWVEHPLETFVVSGVMGVVVLGTIAFLAVRCEAAKREVWHAKHRLDKFVTELEDIEEPIDAPPIVRLHRPHAGLKSVPGPSEYLQKKDGDG